MRPGNLIRHFHPTQYGASWPHREPNRNPQWDCPHASLKHSFGIFTLPTTGFRDPVESSTEALSETVRMRLASTTLRGPVGSSAEAPTGTVCVRPGNQ
eukprot:3501928-Pyramimonas_sp.AAC.1